MRLLYLYPERWTARRAREVQTLSTCAALAETGVDVTLVTAGGEEELRNHLPEVTSATAVPGLRLVALPRTLGPVQSTAIFSRNFSHWLRTQRPFDLAYIVHLKAGPILNQARIAYAYEAHGVFAQTPPNPARQRMVHKLEGQVLSAANLLVATSAPLAVALTTWFALSREFAIVPNAGMPPLGHGLSAPEGPLVYAGSIADGKDLAGVIQAAREVRIPLKIIGGSEEEWRSLGRETDTNGIDWQEGVSVNDLPASMAGARAGLIPTNPDSPWGEFSCPMKLFDYARCGLPVISTALPSLQSLDVDAWCAQIPSPSRVAWVEALRNFRHETNQAEAALAWSAGHTWAQRAELLKGVFGL